MGWQGRSGLCAAGFPAIREAQKPRRAAALFVWGRSIKSLLFQRLKRGQTIRFSDSLDAAYFEQLCSERLITKMMRGRPERRFERIPGKRAETLIACDGLCRAAGFGAQFGRSRRGVEAAPGELDGASSHAIEVAGTGELLARSLEWPECR